MRHLLRNVSAEISFLLSHKIFAFHSRYLCKDNCWDVIGLLVIWHLEENRHSTFNWFTGPDPNFCCRRLMLEITEDELLDVVSRLLGWLWRTAPSSGHFIALNREVLDSKQRGWIMCILKKVILILRNNIFIGYYLQNLNTWRYVYLTLGHGH